MVIRRLRVQDWVCGVTLQFHNLQFLRVRFFNPTSLSGKVTVCASLFKFRFRFTALKSLPKQLWNKILLNYIVFHEESADAE